MLSSLEVVRDTAISLRKVRVFTPGRQGQPWVKQATDECCGSSKWRLVTNLWKINPAIP